MTSVPVCVHVCINACVSVCLGTNVLSNALPSLAPVGQLWKCPCKVFDLFLTSKFTYRMKKTCKGVEVFRIDHKPFEDLLRIHPLNHFIGKNH